MIKKILILVGIIVLVIIAISVFSNKDKTTTGTLVSSNGDIVSPALGESTVGEDFLVTLLNLRSIKLDDTLFADQKFRSLQDFTITLVPEGNIGRPNPFAPIGTDVETTAVTSATATTTPTTNTTPTTTGTTNPVVPPVGTN